jgi:hypothetical protein
MSGGNNMHLRRLVVLAGTALTMVAGLMPLSSAPADATPITQPGSFVAVPPARLLDTRSGAPMSPMGTLSLQVTGREGVPVAASVAAVVLNLTAVGPGATGYLTAWADGQPRPIVSNVDFAAHQTIANLVVSAVSSAGTVAIFNGSGGRTHLIADVSGYYRSGTSSQPGTFVAVPPHRLLDSRNGTGGLHTAVAAQGTASFTVSGAGAGDVPSAGVSAVVLNVTVVGPASGGYLTAWGAGAARPVSSNLDFAAHQTVPNLVVAPLGSGNKVSLYNGSGGAVNLLADVAGYFIDGAPLNQGGLGVLAPLRLLDTRTGNGSAKAPLAALHTLSLQVTGRGGVPATGVSAVVLNLTAVSPSTSGYLTAWPHGPVKPLASSLDFTPGRTVPNLVMAPVSSTGVIDIYNGSAGPVNLLADVTGYYLSADLSVPSSSTSRYVRNINGGSSDVTTMNGEGASDAQSNGAGTHFELLHIGAQSTTSPLSAADPGVRLSATNTRLNYSSVVTALIGYLDGYAAHATASSAVTIAVATSTDGGYDPATMGTDWASKVIEPLRQHAAGLSGVTVLGANDIEAGFALSEAQAEAWETAFLAQLQGQLVFVGSADACPTAFGTSGASCGAVAVDGGPQTQTWTQAQYYRLTHGLNPSQIIVLPQVYVPAQATQWANIDRTGFGSSGHIAFVGSLTEAAACPAGSGSAQGCPAGGSLSPVQGWASLWLALSANGLTNSSSLAFATDLKVDS